MKKEGRKFAIAIFASILIVSIITDVTKAEQLDQHQDTISHPFIFTFSPDGITMRAQSFKVTQKYIYRVDFYFDPNNNTFPTAQLIACIDTDLNPSNGNLSEYWFNVDSWSAGWHTWDIRNLNGDVAVTPGTTYYLILTPVLFNTYTSWHGSFSSTDRYPDGKAYYFDNGTSTWEEEFEYSDYAFRIYTDDDPIASYTYTTNALTLYVNASSSQAQPGDTIEGYSWDWDGDGHYDDYGITANHTYDAAGTYDVTLKVSDDDGYWDTETKSIQITNNIPPVADFSYSIDDKTVSFHDLSSDSDGSIANWTWNFGDGNTSYEQNPTHQYADYGNYTVTLTVKDNAGATDSISKYVNITATQGGGWFTWKLPFSWFAILAIIFILMIGIATSAFFLKPESIKALGYAPAAGTLLITIFIAIAIFMYYAGIAWYWIVADVFVALLILYLVLKLLLVKKKKIVRRLL